MNLLRLRTIAVKETLQMVRDPRLMGLLVAVPAIQLFFFGFDRFRIDATEECKVITGKISGIEEREQTGKAGITLRPDLGHPRRALAQEGLGDLDLLGHPAHFSGITQQDDPDIERIGEWSLPTDHLIMVQLRKCLVGGEHLAILIELCTPAVGDDV